ncbi:phosphate import ATP-binding protein PstB [Ceratobasidium sp. AG-Ba]|nr:phosphate import ATP-binding protein PstB [Ceratobasidium sp. AG-Ba]
MSGTDSEVEILVTDSEVELLDSDSDIEILETVEGSCPCCGFQGELTYIDQISNEGGPSPRKRKRRRSRSPGSTQFMKDLLLAIERPKTQPVPARSPSPELKPAPVDPSGPVLKAETPSFIQKFFSQYPEYKYNPAGETMSQFQQMSQTFKWERGDRRMETARRQLRAAVTQDFNNIYGTDENDLTAWQSLCCVLQLPEVPDDLETCQQLVGSTFVNLVDLVDTKLTKKPVQHFKNEQELSRYTCLTRKFFPLERAYAGGLLKFLLRDIFAPGSRREHDGRPANKRIKTGTDEDHRVSLC